MAEENQVETPAETEEGAEPVKKKSFLMMIIIVLLILLSTIGGFFLFKGDAKEEVVEVTAPIPSIFFEMPELIVSLSGHSSNIRYLKLVVSLEIATAEEQVFVESQLPKITDEFQTYLRQLRLEDLRGSIGTYKLKEALLLRVNQVIQPAQAKNVLIKEMLIQ